MELKAPLDEYVTDVVQANNVEFDLPGDRGRIDFHAFSDAGMVLQLANPDGVVVPVQAGTEVGFNGEYSAGWKLVVTAKKGSTLTHYSRLKPTKVFEFVDPTPLSISRQSNVSPDIPNAIREYIDLQLKKHRIDIDVDELLEDVEDEDFDYEDDAPDFDDAKYLDEEEPVAKPPNAPSEPPAPAAPAPSGEPAPAPVAAPQPPAVPST